MHGSYKFLRIFCSREMAQTFHGLEVCAFDLVCCCLAHFGRGAPVVLARQEVDGTLFDVDAGYSISRVEL